MFPSVSEVQPAPDWPKLTLEILSDLNLLRRPTELNKIDSGSRICYEQSVRLNVALSIEFKLELKN